MCWRTACDCQHMYARLLLHPMLVPCAHCLPPTTDQPVRLAYLILTGAALLHATPHRWPPATSWQTTTPRCWAPASRAPTARSNASTRWAAACRWGSPHKPGLGWAGLGWAGLGWAGLVGWAAHFDASLSRSCAVRCTAFRQSGHAPDSHFSHPPATTPALCNSSPSCHSLQAAALSGVALVHGDDAGVRLPPELAPIQVRQPALKCNTANVLAFFLFCSSRAAYLYWTPSSA